MAIFQPRTFPEIYGDMVALLISATPLTDLNYGSVFSTMLEAAAQEDDEQYFQMLEIIRGYSLDTTTGEELDDRALEYGLTRKLAQNATTRVVISDTSVTKVMTGVYSGLAGPASGTMSVNADSATGFPPAGYIIIGRGTPNVERVPYGSITVFPNYVRFELSASLSYDHGTDEDIILSQSSDRLIPAGTVVNVPAGDITPQVSFFLDENAVLLDGESEVTGVKVTAVEAGTKSNVPVGAIQAFDSLPFATASVRNPERVTNGRDREGDQEFRDRIKDTIQSLSRGTGRSIITNVVGVISADDNKRVVSASLIEPSQPADVVKLYIDDGTGFIPSFSSVGYEEIVPIATGGEKFLRVKNTPVVKAFSETQNVEPFGLIGEEELFVEVGGKVETVLFESTDFETPGAATAQEVLSKINRSATLFEARVSSGGTKIRMFSRSNKDEEIQVTGGSANALLSFPVDEKQTSKLYLKRNNLVYELSKDGKTASIEAGNTVGYNFSTAKCLALVVDGKISSPCLAWFYPGDFLDPNLATASEVARVIERQVPGVTVSSSSNDTKIRITSNTIRSRNSKIRVLEAFSKIFNTESGSLVDRTSFSAQSMFQTNLDYVYVGSDVKFESIYFKTSSLASADLALTFQVFNGTTWSEVGVFDETNGLTANGHILLSRHSQWIPVSVNGSNPLYFVRIRRTNPSALGPTVTSLKISSANEVLGFSGVEAVGANQDYFLNRFIGQIELTEPLKPKDILSMGSFDTRPFLVTSAASNYPLFGGETLSVVVDGVSQSYSFQASDFFVPGQALASEVVSAINREILGVTALTVENGTKVEIRGNTFNGGTLEILESTANDILRFPVERRSALTAHVAASESAEGPFTFQKDDVVIVIADGNLTKNYTVPCYYQSTLTSAISASEIVDTHLYSTFPLSSNLIGHDVVIVGGALDGERRVVSGSNPATGKITLSSALSALPDGTEVYQILPKTPKQVVAFWQNPKITLLSSDVEILTSSGGTRVQLASRKAGEAGSIRVTGGSGNAAVGFSTQTKYGIDAYRYYTGLAQKAQWTVDGREEDLETYPGFRAAGVQVEVIDPVTVPIEVELDVTTQEGVTLTSISNDVRSAVSTYINSLKVSNDVVISDIIYAVKDVTGISDVKVIRPATNIPIADNELPRIREDRIVVG